MVNIIQTYKKNNWRTRVPEKYDLNSFFAIAIDVAQRYATLFIFNYIHVQLENNEKRNISSNFAGWC